LCQTKVAANAYKECLIETYDIYMQSKNKRWDKPFYSRYDKKRKAPKEQLIDFIIQHAKPVTRLKLMVEKDLGTRPVELFWLKVGDIDLSNGNVSITGAKHTIGREGKLKSNTFSISETLHRTKQSKNERPNLQRQKRGQFRRKLQIPEKQFS
jgi:hypothetical protein